MSNNFKSREDLIKALADELKTSREDAKELVDAADRYRKLQKKKKDFEKQLKKVLK